jgi:magnesium chelatase family protein
VARTHSIALVGVEGYPVEIESDIENGLPGLLLVGLPDTALREARDRIRAAIINSHEQWPQRRITVGLSPASLPKRGSGFDLGIALSILAAAGVVPGAAIDGVVFVGELGLDGRLRPVRGVLPAMAAAAWAGFGKAIVAHANAEEAALVPGLRVAGAPTLAALLAWLRGEQEAGEAGVDCMSDGTMPSARPAVTHGEPPRAGPASARPLIARQPDERDAGHAGGQDGGHTGERDAGRMGEQGGHTGEEGGGRRGERDAGQAGGLSAGHAARSGGQDAGSGAGHSTGLGAGQPGLGAGRAAVRGAGRAGQLGAGLGGLAGPAGPARPRPDLSEVLGQPTARRAAEICAAGGHHLSLLGPPGAGKTMLAERLPTVMPELDRVAALEVTSIHSVAGTLPAGSPLMTEPPFCAPHHTATKAAIVGGGSGILHPGAASLAHRGCLFLDEAPEFARDVLDALRQPLESGEVVLARSGLTARFPARFTLVLAANPCPCAKGSAAQAVCSCTPTARRRYLARLSGPLLDRVDVKVELLPVGRAELLNDRRFAEPSPVVAARVAAARERTAARLKDTPWRLNAEVPGSELRQAFRPSPSALAPLEQAMDRGQISARGVDRVIRVAWTLADLAGIARPTAKETSYALGLWLGVGL